MKKLEREIKESLAVLENELKLELDANERDRKTDLAEQAEACLERIEDAKSSEDVTEQRAAAAAFGGLVKRWRRHIILELTELAFSNMETSRERVRQWQQDYFGQSLASAQLRRYARPERSGGGRVAQHEPDDWVGDECAAFYERVRDAIRQH